VHQTFESVLDRAYDADIWLFKYDTKHEYTYDILKDEYQPYSNFRPFKERNIYICHTIRTTYYDDITLHPDRLLEDLIFIYHPELLPGYSLRYYAPMK
jgi:iron complex transport system substrate-binding protein